jgi:hypothetical protein
MPNTCRTGPDFLIDGLLTERPATERYAEKYRLLSTTYEFIRPDSYLTAI